MAGVTTNAQKISYMAEVFQGTAMPVFTTWKIALVTAIPDKTVTNAWVELNKPLYSAYSHGQLNPSPTNWSVDGASGMASNAQQIQIGSVNPNGSAHCVGWVMLDQSNIARFYGTLDVPVDIATGQLPPVIPAGALQINPDI